MSSHTRRAAVTEMSHEQQIPGRLAADITVRGRQVHRWSAFRQSTTTASVTLANCCLQLVTFSTTSNLSLFRCRYQLTDSGVVLQNSFIVKSAITVNLVCFEFYLYFYCWYFCFTFVVDCSNQWLR